MACMRATSKHASSVPSPVPAVPRLRRRGQIVFFWRTTAVVAASVCHFYNHEGTHQWKHPTETAQPTSPKIGHTLHSRNCCACTVLRRGKFSFFLLSDGRLREKRRKAMDDGKYPDFANTVRTSCACNSGPGSIAHGEGAHAWTSKVC